MEREMANAWKGEMQPPKSMLKRFFWSLPTCKGSARAWRQAQAELRPGSGAGLREVGVAGEGGLQRGRALVRVRVGVRVGDRAGIRVRMACSVGELSLVTLAV